MRQKIMTLCAALVLMLTLTPAAQAKTVDLGHGSGCGHVHTSACYTSYNAGDRLCDYCGKPLRAGGMVTVTKSMLEDDSYYDHVCITTIKGTRLTHNGSYTGIVSHPGGHAGFWDLLYDNTTNTGWYRMWYCGSDVRGIEVCGPTGFVDYDGQCTIASEAGSVLTCTQPNDPTYSKCVRPTITYTLPSQWTNQDVTINYSGTTSGSLTFADNGTQSVTATSSTGHRIREDITVDKIDKIAPVMPDYDYSK